MDKRQTLKFYLDNKKYLVCPSWYLPKFFSRRVSHFSCLKIRIDTQKLRFQYHRHIDTLHMRLMFWVKTDIAQLAFTCSKLTLDTLEQGVKYA